MDGYTARAAYLGSLGYCLELVLRLGRAALGAGDRTELGADLANGREVDPTAAFVSR